MEKPATVENQLTTLEIQNFKSIREVKLDCKRINLFIGKPNVGKSNILEAIALFCAPYELNNQKYLSSFIRYEEFSNLFYDQDLTNIVQVITSLEAASLTYHSNDAAYLLAIAAEKRVVDKIRNNDSISSSKNNIGDYLNEEYQINKTHRKHRNPFFQKIFDKGTVDGNSQGSFENLVKKYDFIKFDQFNNKISPFLNPPYGDNLFTILHSNKSFYKEIASLFKEYGLELVLRIKENKLEIQKNIDGIIYSYPYSTIADTLQRIIFYMTAIESNKDSVLLFEEPEAHAFPPYTRMLADRIVHDEKNQYFITTHSPYLLHTIIENTPFDELGLFITYFENYETKVKALSQEELRDILDESIDIFFNLDRFTHEAQP